MKILISWLKNILLGIIISTIMILLDKYVLKIDINSLITILTYIVLFIFTNILWLIKMKGIKFNRIKYSIFIGMFCWGITTATLMNITINNPFELFNAAIMYIIFMPCGFIWGIVTYSITKKLEGKKRWNIMEKIKKMRKEIE